MIRPLRPLRGPVGRDKAIGADRGRVGCYKAVEAARGHADPGCLGRNVTVEVIIRPLRPLRGPVGRSWPLRPLRGPVGRSWPLWPS
ncbi:hypothetical protein FCV25MIE_29185 [Fagus crenata]